jgi:DNA adenine methylase
MSKPLFMWAGGKNKMLKHYAPHMPLDVSSYCEPFFGGGAMFIHVMNRYKPDYARINDINPDIVRIYECIKNELEPFTARLNKLESQYLPLEKEDRKKLYYEIRSEHAWDYEKYSNAEEAATLYFLMKTGFNGVYQLNKNTNGRYGTPSGLLNQKDKVYDRDVLAWWNDALKKTDIYSGDWKDAVEDISEDTFFFFDPPYRESFADYGHGFTDEMLIDLISFCDSKQSVMLSNRDDEEWFAEQNHTMDYTHFDITYTVGRRKKTEDGFSAKKAREILLYRTKADTGLENFLVDTGA